jgi:uncharacterized protein (DUF362 family)
MRTFKQFLTEREDLFKVSQAKLNKSLGEHPEIELTKKQQEFIKHYHASNPKLKSHDNLHTTLGKSNLKNVVPSKKKQNSILAGSHRRASQPDDVG